MVLSRKLTAQLIAAILSQGLFTSQAARFPIKETLTCPTASPQPEKVPVHPGRDGCAIHFSASEAHFLFPDLLPILGSRRPGQEERAWNPSKDGFLSQVAVRKSPYSAARPSSPLPASSLPWL